MIVSMLLAVAMQAPEAQAKNAPVAQEQRRLSLPPEIAPALIPYLQCVMSGMNKEAAASVISSAEAAREAQRRALAGCQATRSQAKVQAVEMLARSKVADREAFAEEALVSIDHAQDYIADLLDRNAQK